MVNINTVKLNPTKKIGNINSSFIRFNEIPDQFNLGKFINDYVPEILITLGNIGNNDDFYKTLSDYYKIEKEQYINSNSILGIYSKEYNIILKEIDTFEYLTENINIYKFDIENGKNGFHFLFLDNVILDKYSPQDLWGDTESKYSNYLFMDMNYIDFFNIVYISKNIIEYPEYKSFLATNEILYLKGGSFAI